MAHLMTREKQLRRSENQAAPRFLIWNTGNNIYKLKTEFGGWLEIINHLMSRYYLGTAKTWPFNLLYLARVLASKLEITGPNQIFPRTHDGIFLGQKRLKGNRVKKEWGKRGCDAKISSKKGRAKDQALQALKILSNSL